MKQIAIDMLGKFIKDQHFALLNKALSLLHQEYSRLKSDPQFSPSLQEVNKYNSKYLVATQTMRNFESFLEHVGPTAADILKAVK